MTKKKETNRSTKFSNSLEKREACYQVSYLKYENCMFYKKEHCKIF